MSTQQEIAALGNSLTPKKFKYALQTVDALKEIKSAPKGWAEGELTFIRDKKYKGVLTQFSTNEMTFVKDGKEFIVSAYESNGIDYEIKVHIYLQNNSTFQYESYFSGKLDLVSYNVDSIGVTVKITDTGFKETVLNRVSIDVDMMSTKYIGSTNDNSMPQLSGVWGNVTIPAYEANKTANWLFNGRSGIVSYYYHYVPMTNIFSEYAISEINDQTFPGVTAFFTPVEAYTGTLKGNLNVVVTGAGYITITIWLYQNGVIKQTYIKSGTDGIDHTFLIDESISLDAGGELYFKANLEGNNLVITYSASSVTLSKPFGTSLPEISIPMFYIFEAFARTLQLYTGKSSPLESNLLGRTDSAPESYATDGNSSLISLTNGKWIRGFNPDLNGLNFSLESLFNSINAIKNIGLGFEVIDGVDKVRIEDEKYFYDISENPAFGTDGKYWKVNQILDLSGDVTNEILSKEVLPDLYGNEVEVGYNDFEYENVQGLKEFNTKSNYAIPVNSIKRKLSLVSDIRGDTQGTNKLRAKPFTTYPTEDVKGDKNNFLFDVKRAGVYVFTVKTDEDFDDVIGGIDSSQSYNLNFTPARNLRNHSSAIRGMQVRESLELQWLKSNKNTSLITKKPGETPIVESADILVDDFTLGFWKPEAYNFEAPVNTAMVTSIKANPYGVIKIATGMYGWILEVQTSDKTGKGQFKLLKVDTNNVKIIIP